MKGKIYTSAALAAIAVFTVVAAANADGCAPVKTSRACHKVARKRVAVAPVMVKETRIYTTKTIEKPIVIEAQQPAPAAVEVVQQPTVITQPAVMETPVVIDRYEKRHRSLLHLGLFPFNLFGQ